MSYLRPAIAALISLCLAVFTPGLGRSDALATMVVGQAAQSAGGAAGIAGAAGAVAPGTGSGVSVRQINLNLGTGLPTLAAPSISAGISPQVRTNPAAAPAASVALPTALPAASPAATAPATVKAAAPVKTPGARAPPAAAAAPRSRSASGNASSIGGGIRSAEAAPTAASQKRGLLAELGKLFGSRDEGQPAATGKASSGLKDLIVMFDGGKKQFTQDVHIEGIDTARPMGWRKLGMAHLSMMSQIEGAGLQRGDLDRYQAQPIATYKRINTATLRLPVSQADAFKRDMESRGYRVYENETRELIRPIEDDPNYKPPHNEMPQGARLSMPDTLKLSTADKIHEIAAKRWGAPLYRLVEMGRRIFNSIPLLAPQPKIGVLDTGADTSHKLLAGVKEVKNFTSAPNIDDNGHGSWVTSMVLWFAPWLKSVTHYKIFGQGSTTLDIILRALTEAGNDGNLVISNSWGSGAGDPKSPDSMLVKKLAQEGHIMVFAAGNSGYWGANNIASPAIAYYRDAATKALRVLAVAATDSDKVVARFSSKGPGSRVTSRGEEYKDYPVKPDLAEQGVNTEAAWPKGLNPDRIDPELGPVRAISGTSMSTPKLAGTLGLMAMMFGVTKVGPELDAIVNGVMKTLVNPRDQREAYIGKGFSSAYAAYEEIAKTLKPKARVGLLGRLAAPRVEKPGTKDEQIRKIIDDSLAFVNKLMWIGFAVAAAIGVAVLFWLGFTGGLEVVAALLAQGEAWLRAWAMSGGPFPL